ncbi:regulator of chromosome condensation 1/beta-lactamase-inhibitor protein II, partial [Auriculariales sp. MPI-PUGE-AT-0066]
PSRRLFIFGSGEFGQLGLGTDCLNEISRPRLHAWFESAVQKGILGGEAAGLETAWAGGMHTLACDEEGKVWSFGINDNASLGRTTENVPDPANEGNMIEQEELETQPMLVQSLDDFRAVQVVSGDSVSVALSDTGHLRAWGSFRSSDGLLGFASDKKASKTQFKPIAIPGLEKHSFISVACGADHVMALTDAGQVFIWGNGEQAQLGRRIIQRRKLNALVPERLALRKINLIGSGSYHSFAQDASGIVYAWGLNTYRQTGVSNADGGEETIIWQPTEISALNPKRLGKGRRVMQISGGEHHTLFLLSDGSVFACGRADDGQVGLANDHPLMIEMAEQKTKRLKQLADHPGLDADAVDELVAEPTLVRFPPPPPSDGGVSQPAELPPYAETDEHMPPVNPISQLSAGTRHNLAVSRSGHVYSWGVGMTCQLGLGPVINHQPTPRRVADKVLDKYKVEHASAGGQHCILLATQV